MSHYHCIHRAITPEYVYHGTSLTQLEAIRDAGWQACNLYLADVREKSNDYTDQQAEADNTAPVVIRLDMDTLRRLGQIGVDPGNGPEEREQDMGQFTYSGPIREAVTNMDEVVSNIRREGEEFLP